MYPLLIVAFLLPKPEPTAARLSGAIVQLCERGRVRVSATRADKLAGLFVRYGRRWKIDPYLAAAIAWRESHFQDRPRKIRVCRTEILDGSAVKVCRSVWSGERGMMQVIPAYAGKSFRACTGRRLVVRELAQTEINVCVALHLLARRRAEIQRRKSFVVRGASYRWTQRYAPCSARQRRWCRGRQELCRSWWVASWNWGSHRVYCGRAGDFDFAGYPLRVLGTWTILRE